MCEKAIKQILIQFPNGEVWGLDAFDVAYNRADYYASKESDPKKSLEVFDEEFDYTARSEDVLADWLFNNMDWKDLKDKEFLYNAFDESSVEKNICEAEVREIIRID